MVICVDLDSCLFDFNTAYGELLVEVSGENRLPADWAGLPTTWEWPQQYGYSRELEAEVWREHILKRGTEFWLHLGLMPDAKKTILKLDDLTRKGHQVYCVSHRMGWGAQMQTAKALYNHGLCYPQVLLAENKLHLLIGLKADLFIDDKPSTIHQVAEWVESNRSEMELYVKKMPYNFPGVYRRCVKVVESVKEALVSAELW